MKYPALGYAAVVALASLTTLDATPVDRFVEFNYDGDANTLSITIAQPVTFTLVGPTVDVAYVTIAGVGDILPYLVEEAAVVGHPGSGTLSFTHNGSGPIFFTSVATGYASGDTQIGDLAFYHEFRNYSVGDTFTLNAGTFTVSLASIGGSFAVPESKVYQVFLAAQHGEDIGSPSAIPEPGSFALLAGAFAVAAAGTRRRARRD